MKLRLVLVLAALGLAPMGLVACGGPDKAPSSPAQPPAQAGPAAELQAPAQSPPPAAPGYALEELTLSEQPALAIRASAPPAELQGQLSQAIPRLIAHAYANQLDIAGPPFVRYLQRSDQLIEYEAGLPVFKPGKPSEDIAAIALPAGPAIATVHVGPYEGLPQAHEFLQKHAESIGRAASGPLWEVFLTNPLSERDPEKWRTKVFLPLAE